MSYQWLADIRRQSSWAGITALLALFILIAGCSLENDPVLTPAYASQTPETIQSTVTASATRTREPLATKRPVVDLTNTPSSPVTIVADVLEDTPDPSPTSAQIATPLPGATGIRPFDASLLRPAELGPESPVEWRPPPVPAPHALHPDDHYWLARPLPSDRRNYDLEVYPYGNMPVLLALRPYRVHHGMDFPNDKGTPIFAAGSGTVIWAGPRPNPNNGINYYGNTVIILHDWQWNGQNVYTLYAHTLELFVEVGDVVDKGQLIAGVGASGEVSGPHLHLEVRVGANHYDNTRNPSLWLAPFEGWGTLAGRFMDNQGRIIHGALVTLKPVDVDTQVDVPNRRALTYAPVGINSDDNWNENFVFSDIPAGEYTIEFRTAGRRYERSVIVQPEITNFIIVQADISWQPTPVPTPMPSLTPTPTGSATPEGTATSTP